MDKPAAKTEPVNAPPKSGKLPYEAPHLKHYGKLKTVTTTGSSGEPELGSSSKTKARP